MRLFTCLTIFFFGLAAWPSTQVLAQDSMTVAPEPKPELKAREPSSGFQFIPKFGLGASRNFLIDLGLIGYSYIPDKNKAQYFDGNISVMALIGRHTMLYPKLDLQAGLFALDGDDLVCFNLGVDVGLLTDFKRSSFMVTPKAGLSFATGLIRIYYLHNFLVDDKLLFPGYGRNGVLLEINISTLQGKGFKTM
jgi:hypothetical protein